ncbi:cation exchanger C521.04c [Biomphalaria pfeifferi]|uniref:Cation exchanger C521.04c n=1 Tax=Biomphalaria pfeifferi TaxID=112525 RepID=A0AAD8FES1_BIOPF|nr:cation exchanger C521.04c [Biomphalaria pfeifferi]
MSDIEITDQTGTHKAEQLPECSAPRKSSLHLPDSLSDDKVSYCHDKNMPVIVIEDQTHEHLTTSLRSRKNTLQKSSTEFAENSIEANRISNNYKFGLKKWKGHVTSRPLEARSEIIQDLYSDINKLKDAKVSTFGPFNIIYTLFFGWWLALVYVIIGIIMGATVIGFSYGKFCWRMAGYFFWPFGKLVYQVHTVEQPILTFYNAASSYSNGKENGLKEKQSLLYSSDNHKKKKKTCWGFWDSAASYVWLLFGIPVLFTVHSVVWLINWFFVISIPTAKLNSKVITKILYLPPNEVQTGSYGATNVDGTGQISEIIMYSHQSVNFYYYKYTVDGVNIILANLLIFVILSIILGYAVDNSVIGAVPKCILSVLAIIPLTYYIGMAITSISAQSSFAVGAILNATFGSMVEVILFIIMLKKGSDTGQECYQELVKSSLTGAILCSILFIPGMSMVTGGIKYRTQKFNPKSANISSSLLFVAVLGVFAPTIFSKVFGSLRCLGCERIYEEFTIQPPEKAYITSLNDSVGFLCQQCEQSLLGLHGDRSLYNKHIRPLVYVISIILPLAYLIGLLFTMKTHSEFVFEEFERELKEENALNGGGHSDAQWSRLKSTIILLLCAVAIALCADLISENIQPLLETSGISEYFIGVTMLSLVAELPEVVNGVQFALQNNVNLGIEIGCSTAIQVCLVQIPLLVLVNLIYPMGFYVVFNDIHLWAVIFSVVIINYIFQDGKSDYFQGFIVVFIYILLMGMYFFMLTPEHALCRSDVASNANTTSTPLNMTMR